MGSMDCSVSLTLMAPVGMDLLFKLVVRKRIGMRTLSIELLFRQCRLPFFPLRAAVVFALSALIWWRAHGHLNEKFDLELK